MPGDPQVAATVNADKEAVLTSKEAPIANIPFPLAVAEPDIFIREVPAGGVLCSSLLWHARNLVRFSCCFL